MAGGLALALSGGGARGAFQVGVLEELILNRGVEFETAAGTSTGAIQAAAVAQDEVRRMVDFWIGLTGNSSVFHTRGGPIWAIITGKDSLYNPEPLRALFSEMYDDEKIRNSGKNLRIAVVNISTGQLRIIDEQADDIANWVYASSAQPPFFPPFDSTDDEGRPAKWVDGGVRDITPLDAALKTQPRAVLVVRAEAPLATVPKDYDNMIEIGLQSVELLTREVGEGDVQNVEFVNRLLLAEASQRRELTQAGVSPDVIERVMQPFTTEIERFHMIPTMVLQPATELYERLEFDPHLIGVNIERGREAVRCQWAEIARFLGVEE